MKKLLISFILLLLAACGAQPDLNEAPEIRHGEDVCERCGMIISDDRYSAAYWTTDGDPRVFDDIGGMLAYHMEEQEDVGSFWVHDFNTREFISADSAYLVLASDLETPMGFGIAACGTKADAEKLAEKQENSMVMSFEQLMTKLDAGKMLLDPEHRHEHDGHAEMDMSGG